MSVFTDDDLKRLKEHEHMTHSDWFAPIGVDKMHSLLSRLSAAETALEVVYGNRCGGNDLYKAWRKSKEPNPPDGGK